MVTDKKNTPLENALTWLAHRVATLDRLKKDEATEREYLRTRGVLYSSHHARVVKYRDARKEAEEGLVHYVMGLMERDDMPDYFGSISETFEEVYDDLYGPAGSLGRTAHKRALERQGKARRRVIEAVKAEIKARGVTS